MPTPEPSHRFNAPWSTALKGMSAFATLLLLSLPVIAFTLLPPRQPIAQWVLCLTGPLVLICSALFMVRGYTIHGSTLQIQRLFWNSRFPLQGLLSVSAEGPALKNSLRLAGNGGVFSFTGLYRHSRIGNYRCFVTDFQNCVVLRFEKRTLVVSPHDPRRFVDLLEHTLNPHRWN